MFGLFKKNKEKKWPKDENSPAFKKMMAEHLHGRRIKYCSERKDNEELLLGKEGSVTVRNDELIVFASGKVVFRTNIYELRASEFLSLEGAFLTGPDYEHGGEEKTVMIYYVYYL